MSQPTISHAMLTLVILCICPTKSVLIVTAAGPAMCPACGQTWRIEKFHYQRADENVVLECAVGPASLVAVPGLVS